MAGAVPGARHASGGVPGRARRRAGDPPPEGVRRSVRGAADGSGGGLKGAPVRAGDVPGVRPGRAASLRRHPSGGTDGQAGPGTAGRTGECGTEPGRARPSARVRVAPGSPERGPRPRHPFTGTADPGRPRTAAAASGAGRHDAAVPGPVPAAAASGPWPGPPDPLPAGARRRAAVRGAVRQAAAAPGPGAPPGGVAYGARSVSPPRGRPTSDTRRTRTRVRCPRTPRTGRPCPTRHGRGSPPGWCTRSCRADPRSSR